MKENRTEFLVVAVLSVVAMSTRLLFNKLGIFNFNAVMATAFFAGAFFSKRKLALLIPFAAMLLTDLALGLYDWRLMAFVYGAFALVLFFGQSYREQPTLLRWVLALLSGSVSFFVITNFAVWLLGDGTFYPHTMSGLIDCYAMGLPFYRNTLLGDITFSTALFGTYELVRLWISAPKRVTA